MKAVIIALVAVFCIMGVSGDAKRHHHQPHRPVWIVYDALPDEWQAAMMETIADFNAAVPPSGPLLVYQRVEPQLCADTTLTVCGGDGVHDATGLLYWGLSFGVNTDTMRIVANISPTTNKEQVLCHEFMHEVGKISWDDYDSMPDTSCIFGDVLTDPGSWDIQRLHEVWPAPHKKHHRKS